MAALMIWWSRRILFGASAAIVTIGARRDSGEEQAARPLFDQDLDELAPDGVRQPLYPRTV
jgi:hypothetical protein